MACILMHFEQDRRYLYLDDVAANMTYDTSG